MKESGNFQYQYLDNVKFFRDSETKVIVERLEVEKFKEIDYLMSMPMRSLTKQKIEELKAEVEKLKGEVQALEDDNALSMYKRELRSLKL